MSDHDSMFWWRKNNLPLSVLPIVTARGCCTTCKGTGSSPDPETNGKCWDCYGTGHAHDPDEECK